jgi:hypothetical protein
MQHQSKLSDDAGWGGTCNSANLTRRTSPPQVFKDTGGERLLSTGWLDAAMLTRTAWIRYRGGHQPAALQKPA